MTSGNWDPLGMYFSGEGETDSTFGAGTYTSGVRMQCAFSMALLVQAFDTAYRATGNTALRDRIVAMARFIDKFGLDPSYQYTGSKWGVKNGVAWHNYSAGGITTFWDPVYVHGGYQLIESSQGFLQPRNKRSLWQHHTAVGGR